MSSMTVGFERLRATRALKWALCLTALLGLACDERNPLYLGARPVEDGGGTGDAAASDAPFGEQVEDAGSLNPDGGMCSPDNCARNFGAPACGTWICQGVACVNDCPNCVDKDGDGFGAGPGCAGPDCDDANPRIRHEVQSRACYQGAAGTRGQGNCRPGTESCAQGVWTGCEGQRTPLPESCNGEDDDCNGQADDLPVVTCGLGVCANSVPACVEAGLQECRPKQERGEIDGCGGGDEDCDGALDEDCDACVRVTGTGNDGLADGSALRPFRTVQAAIAWAHADAVRPRRVCVAASVSCQAPGNPLFGRFGEGEGKSLVMRNGISVVGGYEAATWTLCRPQGEALVPGNVPTLVVASGEGILFPAEVKTPTVLSGFRIERGGSAGNTAAITVAGARGVILSHLVVEPAEKADVNIGVNVQAGSQALITRSQIVAGAAERSSVAVQAKDADIELIDNCSSFDEQGRCRASCRGAGAGIASGDSEGEASSMGVALLGSAARISGNAVCAGAGRDSVGVDVRGKGQNIVIAGNFIHAQGGRETAAGVRAGSCENASPWIVGNLSVTAAADSDDARVAGVLASGACQPRIERNRLLAATGSKGRTRAAGVWCGGNGDGPSACQIIGNELVRGLDMGSPDTVAGIHCSEGACARIVGNGVSGGRGKHALGLWLREGGGRVERNTIAGGCGLEQAIGVFAEDSHARLENNIVFGAACDTAPSEQSIALEVRAAASGRGLDVHSNTLSIGRGGPRCEGFGVHWQSGSLEAGALNGSFRNNILARGRCGGPLFWEAEGRSRPRIFESNLFAPGEGPLYVVRGNVPLSLEEVNRAEGGTIRRNNVAADPRFISFPGDLRLSDDSPAIDTGAAIDAPAVDYEGRPRDAKPDMGAFEK